MSEVRFPQAAMATVGRVLLVDAEPIVLEVCARLLRQAGFTVTALDNPLDVPGALERHAFDVVITDLAMTSMSGIDVLRHVHEQDPDVQVVLMTGYGDMGSAVQAVEYGALRYLTKPMAAATLVSVTANAVALHHLASAKRRALAHYEQAQRDEQTRAELDARFTRAMATLHMVYQPIIRWSDRSVFAYEALLRTKERLLRSPHELFAAATTLGRVPEIGRAVRERVARTLASHPSPIPVFVNIHPGDLDDEDLLAAGSPLSAVARRIVLEVTEHASLETADAVHTHLSALRKLGFGLAVDDLGAGHAGFASLATLQPDVVKIDMSLIRGIDEEPTKQKLVATLTAMCRDLGYLTVAEGVETVAERDTLVGLGCDLMQGYLFALPAEGFPTVNWDTPGRPRAHWRRERDRPANPPATPTSATWRRRPPERDDAPERKAV